MNPLRFALLGRDPLFDPLLAEISTSSHRLAWTEPQGGESSPWEELLHGDLADVVLVGRGRGAVREDQLRRLVQAAIPTVVAHPGSLAPLFCYELDMICRENGCTLLHYYPGKDHPAVIVTAHTRGLRQANLEEPRNIGEIEQITFERPLEYRDKQHVLDQLARDIDLLITIAGTQTKVLALASGEGERAYSGLNVQFSGPSKIISRWSALVPRSSTIPKITITGTEGRLSLEMPDHTDLWRITDTRVVFGGATELDLSSSSGSSTSLDRIVSTVELQRSTASSQPASAARIGNAPRNESWFQACQSIDLLDAVERSILKGRTIELHFEDYTSEATFKGRMSAFGCALLMLGLMTCLFGFVSDLFSGIYQRMLGKQLPPVSRWWPWLLLAGLLAFLFIQVLPKLFPESGKKNAERGMRNGE